MTYGNHHDIERGSIWVNRETGEKVTVVKYNRIDDRRSEVLVEERKCWMSARTFHQEYRRLS